MVQNALSQDQNYGRMIYMRNNPLKRYPSFGLAIGGTLMRGDYGSTAKGSVLPAAQLFIDHRFSESLGYSFQLGGGMYGERYKYPNELYDVRSLFFTGEFHLQFFLNKSLNLPIRSRFYPFITGGVGMMSFNPAGDLKDSKGNFYFGWPDGTFRSQPWSDFQDPLTPIVARDGVFETVLDPDKKYDHFALVMPLGGGLKYFASKSIEVVIGAKVYYTTTDHLDHLIAFYDFGEPSKYNKHNDTFVFSYITLFYNSGKYKSKRFKRPSRRILPSFMY
jgi:hypothetical protein